MTHEEAAAVVAELKPDWTIKPNDRHPNGLFLERPHMTGTLNLHLPDLTENDLRSILSRDYL